MKKDYHYDFQRIHLSADSAVNINTDTYWCSHIIVKTHSDQLIQGCQSEGGSVGCLSTHPEIVILCTIIDQSLN